MPREVTPPAPGWPGSVQLWIDPVPRPGWQNMALDHAMLECAEESGLHLWRLYHWQPHCLSFGRHEPAARRYDRSRIETLGLDTVRRPTGGRAVWHGRELTYAVAAPNPIWGSLRTAYRAIHEVLARAVQAMGASPQLAADRTTPGLGSGACFAATAGGEVVVDGRKVVGSAQRRGTGALLQHGSMLLEDDQAMVRSVQLTSPRSGDSPERPLSALLGRIVAFEDAAAAVAAALGAEPAADGAAPNEVLDRAARHYDSYRSPAWTWER